MSSPARRAALDRADELLQNLSASDRKLLLIKAEIKYEKQEFDDALEQFQYCLDSNPNDYATHYRVADILWKLGDLETAESKLEYVLRMGDNGSLKVKCEKLLTKIRAELKNLKETAN